MACMFLDFFSPNPVLTRYWRLLDFKFSLQKWSFWSRCLFAECTPSNRLGRFVQVWKYRLFFPKLSLVGLHAWLFSFLRTYAARESKCRLFRFRVAYCICAYIHNVAKSRPHQPHLNVHTSELLQFWDKVVASFLSCRLCPRLQSTPKPTDKREAWLCHVVSYSRTIADFFCQSSSSVRTTARLTKRPREHRLSFWRFQSWSLCLSSRSWSVHRRSPSPELLESLSTFYSERNIFYWNHIGLKCLRATSGR